jgi:hypothetical protein
MYNTKYTKGIKQTLKNTQLKNIDALKRSKFIDEDLKSASGQKEYKNIFQSMNENKPYKEQIPRMDGGNNILNMEMKEDLEREKINNELNGGSFWKDFKRGFKKGFTSVTKPAASIMSVIPAFQAPAMVLHGVNKVVDGLGKPRKAKRQQTDAMKRRTQKVKEIMKAQGLSMIEASKYIKDKNIKY